MSRDSQARAGAREDGLKPRLRLSLCPCESHGSSWRGQTLTPGLGVGKAEGGSRNGRRPDTHDGEVREGSVYVSCKVAAASLPPSRPLSRVSPGARPNREYAGKRILGNVVQPGQAATLQSHHTLLGAYPKRAIPREYKVVKNDVTHHLQR